MINRYSNHIGLAALDSSLALIVAITALVYAHAGVAGLSELLAARINIVDAAFGVAFILIWLYCFSILNLYDRFAALPSRFSTILKGVVTMTVLVVVHLFVFHREFLSIRSVLFVAAALILFEVNRIVFRDLVVQYLSSQNLKNVVIVGSGRRAGKAWREIRTRHYSSTHVLGFVDDRDVDEMAPDIASRYLGPIDELNNLLLSHAVDIVLVAMPIKSSYDLMQKAVSIAESVGIQVVCLNDIYATRRYPEQPNRQLFHELFPAHENYLLKQAVKRIFDMIAAAIGILLLAPLLLGIIIAVKLTSRGSAFFIQERFGYRRRTFRMFKFRSMVENAEAKLSELEGLNEAEGPIFKMKSDPRVTPLGKFLRSTSLDELPQLFNVLKGDMSLVGPRPMSVRDVSLFSEAALMRRFSVKPGITGLWQVQGRSSVGFEHWISLDTSYIENWSLSLDFRILMRTVRAVIARTGAV